VLIIIVRPHNFEFLFGAFAVVAVILSTLTRGIVAPPMQHFAHHDITTMTSQRRKILPTFIVAYILYVATETSTSGWIAPQLHRTGYTQSLASLVTAGFWAGMAIGRVLGGPLAKWSSEKILVLGGLVVSIVLCLCAFSTFLSPYAYPLLGLAIASVYPMGLIWYTTLCPHDGNGLALLILFMMAGGVIGPATVSFIVSLAGIHSVPLVIATFAALDLATFATALHFRPTDSGGARIAP
jgi:fucose permease